MKAALSEKDTVASMNELVMNITSDIHYTGRNLCADRGFTSVQIVEELYKRDVTYVGTIKKRRVGVPAAAKEVKDRELLSTNFYWRKESRVMLISYLPKMNNNVLLLTIVHDQPTIDDEPKKSPKQYCFTTNRGVQSMSPIE